MQDYTKKMLRDIKLSHYNKAENELSMIGPPLISGRNIGAYGRKVQELYTTALENIVKDIFECEKKALSSVTAFPRTRYFSTLKKDVLDIANREIHLLGEKLKNRLQPHITSPNTKYSSPSALLDRLQNSIHDQINRAADQLQEEIRLQLTANKDVQEKLLSFIDTKPAIKTGAKTYIHETRIDELKSIKKRDFDLSRLIKYCEELNTTFSCECYLSTAMLVRAIIDHIPPIFSKNTFTAVANNYGGQSFKDSMKNLDNSSRKISDSHLHTQIRKKEVLPNSNQVDFTNDLDVLLAEIYRVLK